MSRDQECLVDYLAHILEAIERIDRYTADLDEVAFLSNASSADRRGRCHLLPRPRPIRAGERYWTGIRWRAALAGGGYSRHRRYVMT